MERLPLNAGCSTLSDNKMEIGQTILALNNTPIDDDNFDEDTPRRIGLFSITELLRRQKILLSNQSAIADQHDQYGETGSLENSLINHQPSKTLKRKRMDRSINNNGPITAPISAADYLHNNNNNNHLKNERLSPSTPDTSSRSPSITPSSASHPDTPPVPETQMRNYSDFMRSLAAKYNNTNPNDYFNAARNGFPPPLDPRFKPATPFPGLIPLTQPPHHQLKDSGDQAKKPPDFPVLNPFAGVTAGVSGAGLFPPLIDMSTTQTLMAMVRTAKDAEIQGLLKNVKRPELSSPLDLSAGAPPIKRPRTKTPSSSCQTSSVPPSTPKRAPSESPKLHEDISNWSVDDVCNFILGIDICAEYAQTFRDQQIDGAGLPMLTEDHLTSKINMKLGPALKLRSILAKKLGSCNVCLHCSHCHSSVRSPEHGNSAGNTSDSGGPS